MEKTYITNSTLETQKVAEELALSLKSGAFLALYGELGFGKTSFTQGLALALGIKRRIISPTFIILRQYKLNKGSFYHVDLYRIENPRDIINLGLDEIINEKENIIVVEWAEKMKENLPKKRIDVHFNYLDEFKREIVVKKYE